MNTCNNVVSVLSEKKSICYLILCEGAVASELVRSTPDQAVRVRTLTGDTLLSQ